MYLAIESVEEVVQNRLTPYLERLSMTTNKPSIEPDLPDFYLQLIEKTRTASSIHTIKVRPTAHKVAGSVAGVWASVKLGTFPPPIKVSTRSVAWIEQEIDALLAAKREMSRTQRLIDLRLFVSLLVAPSQLHRNRAR